MGIDNDSSGAQTVKISPGGSSQPQAPRGPAPYAPQAAETQVEGPIYDPSGQQYSESVRAMNANVQGMSRLGPAAQSEAAATYIGPGPSFGGPAPDRTILIRPNQKPALAWLVVASGPYTGHLYSLTDRKQVVGREAADIVLGDPSASAQHAAIWPEPDDEGGTVFLIQDLASSNGTWVNGEEILKVQLKDDDRLSIGDTALIFKQA